MGWRNSGSLSMNMSSTPKREPAQIRTGPGVTLAERLANLTTRERIGIQRMYAAAEKRWLEKTGNKQSDGHGEQEAAA